VRRALIACALLAGCATNGGGGELTAFTGVYRITDWRLNQAGCDAAGDSVLAQHSETAIAVKRSAFITTPVVDAVLCADAGTCEQKLTDRTLYGPYWFEHGSDATAWTGDELGVAIDAGDPDCRGESKRATLRVSSAGLALEIRRTSVAHFARASDGSCAQEDLARAADALPCGSLETISAIPE
jgi:hypothetical protein